MAKEPEKTTEIAPNEPYPTGNPPDPMEEYWKAHPERKLEQERAAAEAEKAEKSEKVEKTEKKAASEPEEKPEAENVRGRR
jgi:hypothetical protein